MSVGVRGDVITLFNRLEMFRQEEDLRSLVQVLDAPSSVLPLGDVPKQIIDEITRMAKAAVAAKPTHDALMTKAAFTFFANMSVVTSPTNIACLQAEEFAILVNDALVVSTKDPTTVFLILDAAMSLSSATPFLRSAFGKAGVIEATLRTAKLFSQEGDILLAASCTISTMLFADPENALRFVVAGGIKMFVSLHGFAAKRQQEYKKQCNHDMTLLFKDIGRFTKESILMACKFTGKEIDAAVEECSWGRFGENIELDELKWAVTAARKKASAIA